MKIEFVVSDVSLYGQDILEGELFSEDTRNCLYQYGCRTIGHLARMTMQEILDIPGICEEQCAEVVEILAENGIEHPEKNPRKQSPSLPYPQNLIYDILGDEKYEKVADQLQKPDNIKGFSAALECLPNREKNMLILRYKHLYSLEEIGKHYQLTGERARQIIKIALRKLRHPSRRILIEQGLRGYIEYQVEKEVEERTKKLLYQEYMRGYTDGIKAFAGNKDKDPQASFLHSPIEVLELSVRAYNCLKRASKNTIEDLQPLTMEEIMKIRNLGKKSAQEIAEKLRERQLYFPGWEEIADYD